MNYQTSYEAQLRAEAIAGEQARIREIVRLSAGRFPTVASVLIEGGMPAHSAGRVFQALAADLERIRAAGAAAAAKADPWSKVIERINGNTRAAAAADDVLSRAIRRRTGEDSAGTGAAGAQWADAVATVNARMRGGK